MPWFLERNKSSSAIFFAQVETNPLFVKLLENVTAKGFFKGTTEGDKDYKV